MIGVLAFVFVFRLVSFRKVRRKFSSDLTILMQGPKTIADVISLVTESDQLLDRLSGLSSLPTQDQRVRVEEFGLRYHITEVRTEQGTKLMLEIADSD